MVRNGRYMVRMTRHDTPVNEGGSNKHVKLIFLSCSCRISPRIYQLLILTASIVCCKQSHEECFGLISLCTH